LFKTLDFPETPKIGQPPPPLPKIISCISLPLRKSCPPVTKLPGGFGRLRPLFLMLVPWHSLVPLARGRKNFRPLSRFSSCTIKRRRFPSPWLLNGLNIPLFGRNVRHFPPGAVDRDFWAKTENSPICKPGNHSVAHAPGPAYSGPGLLM